MQKIRISKEGLKEFFFKYVVGLGIVLEFLVSLAIYLMLLLNVPTQNGDSVEHIHSAFLISQGYIPYRDFFQHHNPLMWFIFAPVANFFAYDVTVSEVVSFISFLVFLKSLIYVYRIIEEFVGGGRFAGVLGFLFLMIPSFKAYALDFRPDNYMVFCLVGGMYYYFKYLRDKVSSHLVWAGVFFVLSFLFAQKALFPLFVLGMSGLWFWYKKEIKTRDMIKMIVVCSAIMGGFVWYLFRYDIFELYIKSNYDFNLNLVKGFEMGRIARVDIYMRLWLWLGAIGSIWGMFTKDKYKILLGVMFWAEFLQRFFYFSPYTYYYWLLSYLAVLNGMFLVAKLDKKCRLVRVVLIAFVGYFLYGVALIQVEIYKKSKDLVYLPHYITRKISSCDFVFNGDGLMYNMFGKDPHYYWQLIGQLDVIGEETGIREKPNINELIEKYKPHFIYGKSYFNKFAKESGRQKIVHYVDVGLIDKYYEKTPFEDVYELKEEFVRPCY